MCLQRHRRPLFLTHFKISKRTGRDGCRSRCRSLRYRLSGSGVRIGKTGCHCRRIPTNRRKGERGTRRGARLYQKPDDGQLLHPHLSRSTRSGSQCHQHHIQRGSVRSRNGNFPLLLTSVGLTFSLSLSAEDYYIGYRFSTQNVIPVHETLLVSKAMRPCSISDASALTLTKNRHDEPLRSLLQRNLSAWIEFTASHPLRIKNNEAWHDSHPRLHTSLVIPTRCYAVEFNNESVTITPTK